MQVVMLLGMGLAAGFVAGLIGVGGGIIFAPVLLFHFREVGVPPALLSKLTIGSSLCCILVASLASAWYQHRRRAVVWHTAVGVGLSSALAVFLMTLLVTTKPWYDAAVFQVVFGLLLLVVVVRMALGSKHAASDPAAAASDPAYRRGSVLLGIGSGAGAVSSAAGVGGGVVLVPAYHRLLRLPIHQAVGTSSATIALVSMTGVVSYALLGWHAVVPLPTAVGYVDVGRALLLAVPATFSARLGVWAAHRIATRPLRLTFAAVAAFVALRLLWGAL